MSSNEPPYVVRRRETKRSEPISHTRANRIVLINAAPVNHGLGGTLMSTGYDVAAVSANPAQAFTLVASLQPDAVLFVVDALDVATVVRWGRAMCDQHEAVLLLLSSDTSAETRAQFEPVRAHGIVALPTTADALDTAIKAALRAKSAGPELIRRPEPVNDLSAPGNGLPEQRGLLERFAIASARAARTGSPAAVGLIEIHRARQQETKLRAADLNRNAGERLRGLLRQTDAVEFRSDGKLVFLVEDVDVGALDVLGKRITRALSERTHAADESSEPIPIVGMALWRSPDDNLERLLAGAAHALEEKKGDGGKGWRIAPLQAETADEPSPHPPSQRSVRLNVVLQRTVGWVSLVTIGWVIANYSEIVRGKSLMAAAPQQFVTQFQYLVMQIQHAVSTLARLG